MFESVQGGDAPREGRKQALNMVGSAQDNMGVRVEATKAALCSSIRSRVALLAGIHRSVLCLLTLHGTRRSVAPPQCHMDSSRCVGCTHHERGSLFQANAKIVRSYCISLILASLQVSVREQGLHLIFISAAKIGVQIVYHLLHSDMKNLH